MKPLLRNIAAVLVGIVVGSVIDMSLIMESGKVIPPPAGADVTTMEGSSLAYLPMAWLDSRRALGVKDGALL